MPVPLGTGPARENDFLKFGCRSNWLGDAFIVRNAARGHLGPLIAAFVSHGIRIRTSWNRHQLAVVRTAPHPGNKSSGR